MFNQSIFRQNALSHRNAQDNQLPHLVILKTQMWVWLIVIALIMLAAVTWGVFGTIKTYVYATGIIVTDEQITKAETALVEEFSEQKSKVAALKSILDKTMQLYRQHYATIADVEKAREAYLAAKEAVMRIDRMNLRDSADLFSKTHDSKQTLSVIVFLNPVDGKRISSGMPVYILPDGLTKFDHGYLLGQVKKVSIYPVSKEAVYMYLGNKSLAEQYFQYNSPFMAQITLSHKGDSNRNYIWTADNTELVNIESGASVTVKIVTKDQSPLQRLRKYV